MSTTAYTSINANAAPFVPEFPSAQFGLQLPAAVQRNCSHQVSPFQFRQQEDEAH
jgi:hypothetical protein